MLAEEAPIVAVDMTLEWVWRAWHRLGDERHWQPGGMGPGQPCRIPWTAVQAWAREHGMDSETAEFLDDMIVAMEDVFSEWWREKAREAAPKPE
ncbi:hypothetical protein C0V82_16070 [Niveispirillum cyanobacteriorum]|uniref:Uncharacterized protein n=1 Tax=Niveispirillum cyanobacteriorum TaxID=1612173 RepID=A0A2K9NI18_9PROT|nr:hypothetical protein C0V82_16070 [Niveispirillum cyanobacteriorum]GGE85531.1 hypothetical protein GCM10011317_48410 [Niveispirillum cyanobacteriorum]